MNFIDDFETLGIMDRFSNLLQDYSFSRMLD